MPSVQNAHNKGTQGYRWVSKDPVIDLVMSLIKKSGMSFAQIERESGVRRSTLQNWDAGSVKRPHHATVAFVLDALGYRSAVIDRHTEQVVEVVSAPPRCDDGRPTLALSNGTEIRKHRKNDRRRGPVTPATTHVY